MGSQPNILLIFTDMQRADTINALGNPHIITPSLDRLVREGTAFTKCYTPSPVCVSARCSLQYGQYPHRTGVNENMPMRADADDSFVQFLGDAGYRTHGIGKCHFAPNSSDLRGFQTRESQEEIVRDPEQDDYLKALFAAGYDHITDPHGVRGEMYYIPQVAQMPARLHPTQWIGDRSVAFIEEQAQSEQPWYLFSSIVHPHPPFVLPAPWHKLYRSPDMPLPMVPQDHESLLTHINRTQNRYKYRDQGIDNNLMRLIKAYYYGCISFLDYQVGRMLDALEKSGQLDNTLIMFTSDHGEHLGDYNSFGKRSMHSTASRVPMLVRYPDAVPADKQTAQPVSLVDVASTCMDAAGITGKESHFDGESLIRIAQGESDRSYVYSQWNSEADGQYLIVSEKANYFYSAADNKEFYFNHQVDPLETRNRAYTIGESQGQVRKLRRALLKFLEQHKLDYAYEDDGEHLAWKTYPKQEFFNDPDYGLLFQDHPWAVDDIEGYTDRMKQAVES